MAACWATSLVAQTDGQVKEERVWSLQGLRAGYCVRFLIDPSEPTGSLNQAFDWSAPIKIRPSTPLFGK